MSTQVPEVPPAPKLRSQLVGSAIALILSGIVIALLAKVFVGLVIGLLGVVLGIGSRVTKKPPIQ